MTMVAEVRLERERFCITGGRSMTMVAEVPSWSTIS